MTRALVAAAMAGAIGAFGAPAFTQSASTCADYLAADNAGRMAIAAELESANSQMASSQEISSAEIQARLIANCTGHPDLILLEVIKLE